MTNYIKGFPGNFRPNFDREKFAFLELANRGDGLTPINYIYSKDGSFESLISSTLNSGTCEFFTVYSNGVYVENIIQSLNIEAINITTDILKWNNSALRSTDHTNFVAFKAGELNSSTIWTLPLQDGTKGQVLSTDGDGILSFIDGGGGKAPSDATYILQTPNDDLPNSQALSKLDGGILKSAAETGEISIASGGKIPLIDDYVTPLDLQEEILALEAEIAGVLAEATIAGAVAGAEAGAAAGTIAAEALIDQLEITLEGDVIGQGKINESIITTFTRTLNEIPNAGDIDINGFSLKNLREFPQDALDAVSFKFLWDLINDRII